MPVCVGFSVSLWILVGWLLPQTPDRQLAVSPSLGRSSPEQNCFSGNCGRAGHFTSVSSCHLLSPLCLNRSDTERLKWLSLPACFSLSGDSMVKNHLQFRRCGFHSLGWEDPLENGIATHSSILAWKIHAQRSLVGYSPWGCKKSDMTE